MTNFDETARLAGVLRWFCWVGALLDLGAAVQMLSPRLFATMYRLTDFSPGPDYRYAMGMGASLMLGWSVLLLWAARRPLERSGVVSITIVPVVAGLILNEIFALRDQFLTGAAVVPVLAIQVLLAIGALVTLLRVRRARLADAAE